MSFFILRYCDLLGQQVGLRYKGFNRYKSSLGGILTILLLISSLVLIGFMLNSYINKTDVRIVYEIAKYLDSDIIDTSQEFEFAVKTLYGQDFAIREDLFSINLYVIEMSLNNKSYSKTILRKKNCTISDYSKVATQFQLYKLDDSAICFNTTGVTLKGNNLISNISSFMTLEYRININDTNSDYMNQQITNLRPTSYLYFQDSFLQPRDKLNMINSYINNLNVGITFLNFKELDVFFSADMLIITEDKIINDQFSEIKKIILNSYRDKVNVRGNGSVSLNINFLPATQANVYVISYMKFSELLANLGALLNIMYLIFNLIVYSWDIGSTESALSESLMQEYKVCLEKEELKLKQFGSVNNSSINSIMGNENKLVRKAISNQDFPENFDEIKKQPIISLNNNPIQSSNLKNRHIIRPLVINIENPLSAKTNNNNLQNSITNRISENRSIIKSKIDFQGIDLMNKEEEQNKKIFAEAYELNANQKNEEQNRNQESLKLKDYEIKSKVKKEIKLNPFLWLLLKYFRCCFPIYSKKRILFQEIESYLNDSMDVFNIHKMHFDLQILKSILFDDKQKKMLRKIPIKNALVVFEKLRSIDSLSEEKVAIRDNNVFTQFFDNKLKKLIEGS